MKLIKELSQIEEAKKLTADDEIETAVKQFRNEIYKIDDVLDHLVKLIGARSFLAKLVSALDADEKILEDANYFRKKMDDALDELAKSVASSHEKHWK